MWTDKLYFWKASLRIPVFQKKLRKIPDLKIISVILTKKSLKGIIENCLTPFFKKKRSATDKCVEQLNLLICINVFSMYEN